MTPHALSVSLVLAVAAGGTAVTITKSKFFTWLREWAWVKWRLLGVLLYCPYCTTHWLVIAGVLVYRPRLVDSGAPVIDVFVTGLAIIAAAVTVAALIVRAYTGMFADAPPPGWEEEYGHLAIPTSPDPERVAG